MLLGPPLGVPGGEREGEKGLEEGRRKGHFSCRFITFLCREKYGEVARMCASGCVCVCHDDCWGVISGWTPVIPAPTYRFVDPSPSPSPDSATPTFVFLAPHELCVEIEMMDRTAAPTSPFTLLLKNVWLRFLLTRCYSWCSYSRTRLIGTRFNRKSSG